MQSSPVKNPTNNPTVDKGHLSKRLRKFSDPSIIKFLEDLASHIMKSPVPMVLTTGEKLACDAAIFLNLSYYMPGNTTGYANKNSLIEVGWFVDSNCFDWRECHDDDNELCIP